MQDTSVIAWDDLADVSASLGDGVPDTVRARFEGALVVARLDAQLGGDWSFSVLERRELPTGQTLARGRLTAFGRISKDASGTSSPCLSASLGDEDPNDDAYVEAVADALRRCAELLGVGGTPARRDRERGPRPCSVADAPLPSRAADSFAVDW